MPTSIYLAVPLMILLGVAETAVLPHFSILGSTPQLVFMVALAWGLLFGIEEGTVWAFFAGISTDLFSITPVGISSFAFMGGITAVLWLQHALPKSRLLLPLLFALLATIISFITTLLLLRLFGIIDTFQSITVLPTTILINILTILPIYWLIYMIQRVMRPRRVKL